MATSAPLRRLGAELRRLRENAGMTQSDVGSQLGRTHTTLVNWELGKTRISKSDLACLLAELGARSEVHEGLEQLREDARRSPNQWVTYNLPDWLRPLVSFEEEASAIQTFEPVLVPGLLQTENYAHALHKTGHERVASHQAGNWVAARMRRQRRLRGTSTLDLHVVIAETALQLEVGDPRILDEQLEQLAEWAARDNITLQILPHGQVGYAGVASNFLVLHFDDHKQDPSLGYSDGPLGGYMISSEDDVAILTKLFNDLCKRALSPSDSVATLTMRLKQRHRDGDAHD